MYVEPILMNVTMNFATGVSRMNTDKLHQYLRGHGMECRPSAIRGRLSVLEQWTRRDPATGESTSGCDWVSIDANIRAVKNWLGY